MSDFHAGGRENYSRLPEDLLADLLADTPAIAQQVTDLLVPALRQREQLRRAAESSGMIASAPLGPTSTVCAIDGGFAVERTVAVDIVMALAVGVEGYAPAGMPCAWDDNQYNSFHRVLVHNVDNERLARAAMVCHELAVIADAPHEVRVYDGSHLTPIIQFNSGLSSKSNDVRDESCGVAWEVDLESALDAFVNNPKIVGMPKYDSSRDLADSLSRLIGNDIPGDDKYVTSLILSGGEYTIPRQVPPDPWRQLHLTPAAGAPARIVRLQSQLEAKLHPLRSRQLYYTYWRPNESAPTYRIEMKPDLAADPAALGVVFSTLGRQITGPFVREPYPQYLADVMAKSVGLGLSALQAAAHLVLTRTNPELGSTLVHSYRTEGI